MTGSSARIKRQGKVKFHESNNCPPYRLYEHDEEDKVSRVRNSELDILARRLVLLSCDSMFIIIASLSHFLFYFVVRVLNNLGWLQKMKKNLL